MTTDRTPAPAAPLRPEPARMAAVRCVLLLLAALAAHAPALRGGYVWDDAAITDNPLLRIPGGLRRIWFEPSANRTEAHYWPLTYTAFWAIRRVAGDGPAGFHAASLALHALSSLLAWRVLAALGLRAAWPAALLFAVHPVRAESIAWAIELKDVLSAFLFFAAMLACLKGERTRRNGWFAAGTGLFLAGMLAKSSILGLPLALGLAAFYRGRISRRGAAALLAMAAAGGALAWADSRYALSRDHPPGLGMDAAEKAVFASRVLWFHLGKTLWPSDLMAIHSQWEADPSPGWAFLFPAGLLGAGAGLILLARKGRRGPLAAAGFFAVMLGPTLGFIEFGFMKYAPAAERFQYLACLGPVILAVEPMARIRRRRIPAWRRGFGGPGLLAAAALAALIPAAWIRGAAHRDLETLFARNAKANPDSWKVRDNWGLGLARNGKPAEAAEQFRIAAELNPAEPGPPAHLAAGLMEESRFADALPLLDRALERDPVLAEALYNRALVRRALGRPGEAAADLRALLTRDPEDASAHRNLGLVLWELGSRAEGAAAVRRAAALRPGDPEIEETLRRMEAALRSSRPGG